MVTLTWHPQEKRGDGHPHVLYEGYGYLLRGNEHVLVPNESRYTIISMGCQCVTLGSIAVDIAIAVWGIGFPN
jgi:hypothetical protein